MGFINSVWCFEIAFPLKLSEHFALQVWVFYCVWLWNYKWSLIFPCNRFRKRPSRILSNILVVNKVLVDLATKPNQFLSISPIQTAECRYVMKSISHPYTFKSNFQLMKLVEFQHWSGSSMCPVVWFREEFKTKCHQDRASSGPLITAHLFTTEQKTHMPVTGAFAENPAFHGPVGFHSFKQKIWTILLWALIYWLPPNDKVIKYNFHFKMPFIFSFFGNKHLISSSKHMKNKVLWEGQSMGLYQRVNDSIISLP